MNSWRHVTSSGPELVGGPSGCNSPYTFRSESFDRSFKQTAGSAGHRAPRPSNGERSTPTVNPAAPYTVGKDRSLRGWVRRLLDRIDDRVTERADRRAIEMGLTITRIPGSRTQVYRDSRFDRRQVCEECAGSGMIGTRSCTPCDGWGVVTLPAPLEGGDRR